MQATVGGQALAFKQFFQQTFGNTSINFNTDNFKNIVHQCLVPNIYQRKILVLYCHNEIEEFGKTVCRDWFNDSTVIDLLKNPNFIVTGYNITTEEHRNDLIQQMSATMRDDELFLSIKSGESKIYVFVPYLNNILCQTYIDERNIVDGFIEELLSINDLYVDIKTNLEEDIQSNDETCTCQIFQQIMFDKLGNRDFDVFFKEDHKHLKDKIGYAFFGPPTENGYEKKQNRFIEKAYKVILTQSDKYASSKDMVIISIIYVCYVKFTIENKRANIEYEKFNPVPIFILRKCYDGDKKGSIKREYCRTVIDNTLRVYTSWTNFLKENKYPECILCTPKDGEYICDNNGNVLLENHNTPACAVEKKLLRGLDITSAVAGIGSGGLLLIAAIPAVTLAPVAIAGAAIAGATTGAYAICRSIISLVDRHNHEEDLSFSDTESRAAYLNIAAGALGFVGAGANAVLANMAREGVQVGRGTIFTINALGTANITAGGIALGNNVYDVTRGYFVDNETPSPLVLVQLSASALFFGNAVYNFQSATTIITETQKNSIQQIKDSFRSSRHRRTFTKLQKQSIRVNNGDTLTANAKVISTIRNADNVDETMAILTRNNKRFNELGIKYSAQDGHVSLNGQTVDITTFSAAVNKAQISEILALPQDQIATLASNSKFNVPWIEVGKLFVVAAKSPSVERAAINLLYLFRPHIQRKLVQLVKAVFNINNRANANVRNNWRCLGVGATELSCVVDFICDQARTRLKLGSFGRGCVRVTQLLVHHFLCGRDITDILVNECLDYLITIIAQRLLEAERRRLEQKRLKGTRELKHCAICLGYHHT